VDGQPDPKIVVVSDQGKIPIEIRIKVEQQSDQPQGPPPSGLGWSDLAALFALVGLVVYGFVGFAYFAFLDSIDVRPEEVGVSYITVISKAGIAAAFLLALAAIMGGGIGLLTAGFTLEDQRRYLFTAALLTVTALGLVQLFDRTIENSTARRFFLYLTIIFAAWFFLRVIHNPIKRFLDRCVEPLLREDREDAWGGWRRRIGKAIPEHCNSFLAVTAGIISLFTITPFLASLQEEIGAAIYIAWGFSLVATIFGVLLALPGTRNWARGFLALPWPAILSIIALVAFGSFIAAANIGNNAAGDLKDNRRMDDFFNSSFLLPVGISRVCVYWGSGSAPQELSMKHELIYLGEADGTLVLFDTEPDRAIRVSTESVVLIPRPEETLGGEPGECPPKKDEKGAPEP
jgi:hypothetical protein